MNKQKIIKIQKNVFAWYKKHGRHDLPWRATDDPYAVAVAEIMLQQTNVPKVIQKFTDFMGRFPAVENLARANQKTVIMLWQGLGYNRRARYLHQMARAVVKEYGGVFPLDPDVLRTLPGIGPYTSKSIGIFACNHDIATWDVNIIRLLRRWYGEKEVSEDIVAARAESFLPKGRSRDWHNALMDLASTICTKRSPRCLECPLKEFCKSYPDPDDYIHKARKEVGRSECGKHIPRRIYRGRIVEFLREKNGSVDQIGSAIKKDWSREGDHAWCEEVLRGLSKDGMVMCKKDVWMLQ